MPAKSYGPGNDMEKDMQASRSAIMGHIFGFSSSRLEIKVFIAQPGPAIPCAF